MVAPTEKFLESAYVRIEKRIWVQANVFLSKDENLTKAHTRYLEGRLINEARRRGGRVGEHPDLRRRWRLRDGM
jgi:hypothetical protein